MVAARAYCQCANASADVCVTADEARPGGAPQRLQCAWRTTASGGSRRPERPPRAGSARQDGADRPAPEGDSQ